MRCAACGMSFRRAALLAMLADTGAQVSPNPNYCHDTEDHEHDWKPEPTLVADRSKESGR